MKDQIVHVSEPVTLVGGGAADINDLETARLLAPCVYAVDGGLRLVLAAGHAPAGVIGDFDSANAADLRQVAPKKRLHIAEQDSTDFDKALRSVLSPLVLAVGFTGARIDHQLANLNTLVRRAERAVILLGATELIFHVPRQVTLPTEAGDTVSLVPLSPVTGHSQGLRWPIDGLGFAPDGRVGTSNQAEGAVFLTMDGPGMIGIIPRARLAPLAEALLQLGPDARWSVRA